MRVRVCVHVCQMWHSYIDCFWAAPVFPLVFYLVFQGEDVQVGPGARRRPLHQQVSAILRGNPDMFRRVWFHCAMKQRYRRESLLFLARKTVFLSVSVIKHTSLSTNSTLTNFLQHKTCDMGANAARINCCDVDDVVGKKLQGGKLAVPELK